MQFKKRERKFKKMTNSNSDRYEFFSNSQFLGDFGQRCEIKAGCGQNYAEVHLQ